LHAAKPPLEFGVRTSRGRFRVDAETACEIGDGEEKIADLVHDGGLAAGVEGCLAFRKLFAQFREDRLRRLPIEADARGARLQLLGSSKGGQGEGDAVEKARRPGRGHGAAGILSRLL